MKGEKRMNKIKKERTGFRGRVGKISFNKKRKSNKERKKEG